MAFRESWHHTRRETGGPNEGCGRCRYFWLHAPLRLHVTARTQAGCGGCGCCCLCTATQVTWPSQNHDTKGCPGYPVNESLSSWYACDEHRPSSGRHDIPSLPGSPAACKQPAWPGASHGAWVVPFADALCVAAPGACSKPASEEEDGGMATANISPYNHTGDHIGQLYVNGQWEEIPMPTAAAEALSVASLIQENGIRNLLPK